MGNSSLGRVGDAVIDTAARRSGLLGIIGSAAQAGFQTEGYQQKQRESEMDKNSYEIQKLQLERMRRQAEEDEKNRPLVDLERKNAMNEAQYQAESFDARKSANELAMKAKNAENQMVLDTAKWRTDSTNAVNYAKTLGAQTEADSRRWADGLNAQEKSVMNALRSNPDWSKMSFAEQNEALKSEPVQGMIELGYVLKELNSVAGGDKDTTDYLERIVKQNGWGITSRDGVMSIDMGDGREFPVTKDGLAQLDRDVTDMANDEVRTRFDISTANTLGNPMASAVGRYIRGFMPLNNGSAIQSKKTVNGILASSTPEEQVYFTFNQAFRDFGDVTIPESAKMNELAICAQSLQHLGITASGGDPKNPNPLTMTFSIPGYGVMSFQELGKYIESKDTLGNRLDGALKSAQDSAVRQGLMKVMSDAKTAAKDLGEKKDETVNQSSLDEQTRKEMSTELHKLYGTPWRNINPETKESVLDAIGEFEMTAVEAGWYDENRQFVNDENKLKEAKGYWDDLMEGVSKNTRDKRFKPEDFYFMGQKELDRFQKDRNEKALQVEKDLDDAKAKAEAEQSANRKRLEKVKKDMPEPKSTYQNEYTNASLYGMDALSQAERKWKQEEYEKKKRKEADKARKSNQKIADEEAKRQKKKG